MPTLEFIPLVATSFPQMALNAVQWLVTFLGLVVVAVALYGVIRAALKASMALGAIVAAGIAGIVLVVIVRLLTSGQGAKAGEETVKFFEIALPPGTFRVLTSWILGA